jgi:hypothetical protein
MQLSDIYPTGISPDQWFMYASQLAMLGWLILIFLPRKIKLLSVIPQYVIPFALSLLYAGSALTTYFTSEGGYDSLMGLRTLFESDQFLLAGWVHYLAFDLFIGAWIARNADRLSISRLLQAPILIMTFMFGPVGLVLFLAMRMVLSPSTKESENQKGVTHA